MGFLMPETGTQSAEPTAEEKAAIAAAREDRISEAQQRAGEDTDRLFRLFGARNSTGINGQMGMR
jgi:hypothetical protein